VQWLDYSRAAVIALSITSTLTCATCEDGTLVIYSNSGVKLLAPIRLDSPASFLHAAKDFVMVITCKGTMNAW
jgi:protein HIRA/HIR1